MSTETTDALLAMAGVIGYVPHPGMTLRESLKHDGVELGMENGYVICSNYPIRSDWPPAIVFGMDFGAGDDTTVSWSMAGNAMNYGGLPHLPASAKLRPSGCLHPLQRMSSQPSAFGQSMWRPWERL